MAESYSEFISRTSFTLFDCVSDGQMTTNPGLERKVAANGSFLPFCGNTVIYKLDRESCLKLASVRDILYKYCGSCLAEELRTETFHLTLHDLLTRTEDFGDSEVRSRKLIYGEKDAATVRVIETGAFCMVNTSIVMGFRPTSAAECRYLTQLYDTFQEVVHLPYLLTPHVTLAYFKPGQYDSATIKQAIFEANNRAGRIELSLRSENLIYSTFNDMNTYTEL